MSVVWERLRRHPGLLTRLLFAALMINLLGIASSLYTIQVLNRYVVYGVTGTLVTLTVGVVLAILGELAFRGMRLRLAAEISREEDARLSIGLFGLLLTAPLEGLRQRPVEALESMVRGVDQEANTLGAANIAALTDLPYLALFLGIIALLAPPLAWVTLLVMLLLALAGWLGQRGMNAPVQEWNAINQRHAGLLATALRAPESVRHFGGREFLMASWGRVVHDAARIRRQMALSGGDMAAWAQALQTMGSVVLTAVGALLVVDGKLDVGSLIGVNILASRAFSPMGRLVTLAEAFKKAEMTLNVAREFARGVGPEPESGSAPLTCRGDWALRQVAMQWPAHPVPLIQALSVEIPAGSIAVVTGPNGSGKSTLLALMAGLLRPTGGQILVDGIELRQLSPEWRRRQLGYLPQEPTFLAGSLRENLSAVEATLDEERMRALLTSVGAGRFLAEHPAGLDLALSHDGREVPPGIRRRFALARALAADAPMMLLDEPTEGLDREATAQVYALLIDLARRGKTLVIASHDESILQGAGRVIDLGRSGVGR
ncbi:MAG: ATP-binding cassette domain-containing protein [Magnetococcales bacterium]|nr:ATP-binding cassette domain-containing protein [Magnetococcales bacterium]